MRELLAVVVVGLGTYAFRASMIVRGTTAELPQLVRRGLRHLSPAVLGALILPTLLLGEGGALDLRAAPLTAAAVATLVARRTNSIPWVLASGLAAHEFARWLL